MYCYKKQHTPTTLLIALLLTLIQSAAFAQAQKPPIPEGVYDTYDWSHPISVRRSEKKDRGKTIEILRVEDYKGTVLFEKVEGETDTFKHPDYPEQTLRRNETNKLLLSDAGNGYQKQFILYSPRNEEPVAGVQKFEYLEDYFYFKTEPSDNDVAYFAGKYLYDGNPVNGEPIIELREKDLNGVLKGDFQLHNSVKEPISWWIETDYKGQIKEAKFDGGNRYHIVIRYEKGSKFAGDYRRLLLDDFKKEGKMVLLRERVKVKEKATAGGTKTTIKDPSNTSNTNAAGRVSSPGTGNNTQRAATTPASTKTSTPPAASTAKDMVDYKEVAKGYQAKMKADPDKAQIYSFCAAAAVAKSTLSPEAFDTYAKRIAASLKTLVEDKAPCPCADVIPAQTWKEASK